MREEPATAAEHISKALMAREVNARVLDVARRLGDLVPDENALLTFVCECSRTSCYGRVELSPSEYEEAHSEPGRSVILPTHPLLEGETEVARTERYAVIVGAAE